MNLKQFFSVSSPVEPLADQKEIDSKYKRLRWQVFLSATLGYGNVKLPFVPPSKILP